MNIAHLEMLLKTWYYEYARDKTVGVHETKLSVCTRQNSRCAQDKTVGVHETKQ